SRFAAVAACSLAGSVALAQGFGDSAPALQLDLPALNNYATPFGDRHAKPLTTTVQPDRTTLAAQLVTDGKEITRGLVWRVFKPVPGPDGKLSLVASARGGTSAFDLEPGSYLVHAAFGRAGATKRITVGRAGHRETIVLDPGGLEL